jgi:hypothetical protein
VVAALLFLYRDLLERDLKLSRVVRARSRRRLPVVLTTEEVRGVLERLDEVESLVAGLLYGSGLRLMEALRLRVQDLDFNRRTLLPDRVAEQRRSHLQTVRTLHQQDLPMAGGTSHCPMPWHGTIQVRQWSGDGSGCSRKPDAGAIRPQENREAITLIQA